MIKMIVHRPIAGKVKSLTISRAGRHWHASILAKVKTKALAAPPVKVVGIDLNVVTGVMASDGDIRLIPRISPEEMHKQARLQKGLARKKMGSANWWKARHALAGFHARLKRQRRDAAHKIPSELAGKATRIAVEDLKLRNMTASARGTIEMPGHNVRQKTGVNRSLQDLSPRMIRRFVEYKVAWAGGVCVAVDPRRTSQRRSECGRHPGDDIATADVAHGLITRDEFLCPPCSFACHADINAARNILALDRRHWTASIDTAV
jgi:putative transposase